MEDWVDAWVAELADDLLARGEASLTTCRGSVEAWLRRPGRLRKGALRLRVTGARGFSSSNGGTTRTGDGDLRDELTFLLTFEVLNLAGM